MSPKTEQTYGWSDLLQLPEETPRLRYQIPRLQPKHNNVQVSQSGLRDVPRLCEDGTASRLSVSYVLNNALQLQPTIAPEDTINLTLAQDEHVMHSFQYEPSEALRSAWLEASQAVDDTNEQCPSLAMAEHLDLSVWTEEVMDLEQSSPWGSEPTLNDSTAFGSAPGGSPSAGWVDMASTSDATSSGWLQGHLPNAFEGFEAYDAEQESLHSSWCADDEVRDPRLDNSIPLMMSPDPYDAFGSSESLQGLSYETVPGHGSFSSVCEEQVGSSENSAPAEPWEDFHAIFNFDNALSPQTRKPRSIDSEQVVATEAHGKAVGQARMRPQSSQGGIQGTPVLKASRHDRVSLRSLVSRPLRPADAQRPGAPNYVYPRRTGCRESRNEFLIRARMQGATYKEIKHHGGFKEAVSTLRGRHRSLTIPKECRKRRPDWSDKQVGLLYEAVQACTRSHHDLVPGSAPVATATATGTAQGLMSHQASARANRIPWKRVAEYINNNGGGYLFGNATCRRKWDNLHRTPSASEGDKDEGGAVEGAEQGCTMEGC